MVIGCQYCHHCVSVELLERHSRIDNARSRISLHGLDKDVVSLHFIKEDLVHELCLLSVSNYECILSGYNRIIMLDRLVYHYVITRDLNELLGCRHTR